MNKSGQKYCLSKPSLTITISQECSSSVISCKLYKEKNSIIHFSNPNTPIIKRTSHKSDECITMKSRNSFFRRAKKKSIKLSFSIVLTFIICWTPYYIVYFLRSYHGPVHRFDPRDPGIYSFFFGHMNGIINPIICGVFQMIHKSRRSRSA